MVQPVHRLRPVTLALLLAGTAWLSSAAFSAQSDSGANTVAPAAEAASAPGTAASSPSANTSDQILSYAGLMKLSPDARRELIEKLPSEQQSEFLFSLSGMQRAVLMFDPEDCGTMARLKRRGFATGEKVDSIGEQLLKSGQGAVGRGLIDLFVPGGKQLIQAAEINEARKGIQTQVAYVDVCDLPSEARTALLKPGIAPPIKAGTEQEQAAKPSTGVWDKLSEVITR